MHRMPRSQLKMSKDLTATHQQRDHYRTTYLMESIGSPLHRPCRKDLRVSYLEQYEQISSGKSTQSHLNKPFNMQNRHYDAELDRSQTRDALKDITEKYGFDWDHRGKLVKKCELYPNQQTYDPKNRYRTSGLENRQNCYKFVSKSPGKLNEGNKDLENRTQAYEFEQQSRRQSFQNSYNQMSRKPHFKTPLKTKDNPQLLSFAQDSFKTDLNKRIANTRQTNEICFKGKEYNLDQKQIDDKINMIWQKYHRGTETTNSSFTDSKPPAHKKPPTTNQVFAMRNSISLSDRELPHFGSHDNQKQKTMHFQSSGLGYRQDISRNAANRAVANHKADRYKEEIQIITSKIKQCEKQKQKLQIAHKKFDCNVSSSKESMGAASKNLEKSQGCYLGRLNYKNDSYDRPRSCSPFGQIMYEQVSTSPAKSETCPSSYKASNTINQQRKEYATADQTLKALQSSQLKQQQQPSLGSSSLTAKLCKQIELDSDFRKYRTWFNKNDDPHKWGILADCLLAEHGLKFNYQQLLQKFQNCPEEEDPYTPAQTCEYSYNQLISCFIVADTHWTAELSHKLTVQNCQQDQFTSKQLDRENKGKITIQNFIRYLNLRTNKFHNKRDIYILFQRFTGKTRSEVTFSQILQSLIK